MPLHESGQMYLETIYILSKQGDVRSIDICEHMGYSKPSVSRAMGILKADGYVENDADGFLRLTESGLQVAENTYQRHKLLTEFFSLIGVSEDTASEDACRIEHHLSDESFQALLRHVEGLKPEG